MKMPKMLTVKETAQVTNMSEYAIRQGIRSGLYPAIRICANPTGKILINIDAFITAINDIANKNVCAASDGSADTPIRLIRKVAE